MTSQLVRNVVRDSAQQPVPNSQVRIFLVTGPSGAALDSTTQASLGSPHVPSTNRSGYWGVALQPNKGAGGITSPTGTYYEVVEPNGATWTIQVDGDLTPPSDGWWVGDPAILVQSPVSPPPVVAGVTSAQLTAATSAAQTAAEAAAATDATSKAAAAQAAAESYTDQLRTDVAAGYAPLKVVNALSNSYANLKGDGSTNDQTNFQTLVTALGAEYAADANKTPRVIYCPKGIYSMRDHGTVWASGVGIRGDGPGLTVFKLANSDNTNPAPLASFTASNNGASTSNPLTDCIFEGFEIDGSGVSLSAYNVGAKGLSLQYMLRPKFRNLYIHDTGATGLGCDHLLDGVIDTVIVERCGRLNDGTQLGGAGIGIGVGGWVAGAGVDSEPLVVSNIISRFNGTHGLFFELQNSAWTRPRGIRVVNAHLEGNRYGISDWGCDGLQMDNVTALNNLRNGFDISGASGVAQTAGINGQIGSTCRAIGNAQDGIQIGDQADSYTIAAGVRATGNGRYGVRLGNANLPSTTGSSDIGLLGITASLNGLDGVRIDATMTDPMFDACRLRGNGQQQSTSDTNSGGTITYTGLTVTDSSKAWTVNGHVGKTVTVGAQTAIVRSNTATVLTLWPWHAGGTTAWVSGTPAAGTSYSLPAAPTVRAGLTFNAIVNHPVLRGGRFWDNQTTKTQTHGWWITTSGTCPSATVVGVDMQGNLTGANNFQTQPSGGYWNLNQGLATGVVSSPSNSVLDGPLVMGGFVRLAGYATGSRPTASSASIGGAIYDTTLSKPVFSDGTNWRDAAGTVV